MERCTNIMLIHLWFEKNNYLKYQNNEKLQREQNK